MQRSIRACAKSHHLGASASQPGHHQFAHSQIDEGLAARTGALKIAREPTAVGDPGIRPFDDSPPGEHMKAFGHDLVPVDLRSFGCPDVRMPVHGWFTISSRTPRCSFTQCWNGEPAYPLSAQINWRRWIFPTKGRSSTLPLSRSPISAASTLTEMSRPCVSTSRCRFLP